MAARWHGCTAKRRPPYRRRRRRHGARHGRMAAQRDGRVARLARWPRGCHCAAAAGPARGEAAASSGRRAAALGGRPRRGLPRPSVKMAARLSRCCETALRLRGCAESGDMPDASCSARTGSDLIFVSAPSLNPARTAAVSAALGAALSRDSTIAGTATTASGIAVSVSLKAPSRLFASELSPRPPTVQLQNV